MTDFVQAWFEGCLRLLVPGAAVAILSGILLRQRARLEALAWGGVCLSMILTPVILATTPRVEIRVRPLSTPLMDVAHFVDRGVRISSPDASPDPWNHVHYQRTEAGRDRLVFLFWAAGGVLVILAIAVSSLRLTIRLRSQPPILHPWIPVVEARLGLGHGTVTVHPRCRSPLTIGLTAPRILLPPSSLQWEEAKIEAVLAHEISHFRNRDPLWNAVGLATCCLYWFHPLSWFAFFRMRHRCEDASDQAAVAAVGSPRRYARYLVEIAGETLRTPGRGVFARPWAMMARPSSLRRRVDRILRNPESGPRMGRVGRAGIVAASLVLGLAAATVGVRFAAARVPLASSPIARPLLSALASGNPQLRADALFKLSRWASRQDEVIPLLLGHLRDSEPIPRMPRWSFSRDNWAPANSSWEGPSPGEVAALGLASIGEACAPALIRMLDDPDPTVRRNAAWALGELRHPRGISARGMRRLRRAVSDPDATVRAAAAWSLGDIGSPDSEPVLRAALRREGNPRARAEEAASLRAVEAGLSLEFFRHRD
jgi:beta-lactamase regulating signal transducer with metallopeptidase domain